MCSVILLYQSQPRLSHSPPENHKAPATVHTTQHTLTSYMAKFEQHRQTLLGQMPLHKHTLTQTHISAITQYVYIHLSDVSLGLLVQIKSIYIPYEKYGLESYIII